MGKALRELKIPIGEVDSSPTYRALETVRLAQLGKARPVVELGDGGRGMQASSEAQASCAEQSEGGSGGNQYHPRDAFSKHARGVSAVVSGTGGWRSEPWARLYSAGSTRIRAPSASSVRT